MASWGDQDEFLSVSSSKRGNEEALHWAATEKLSTYKRMRTSLLKIGAGGDNADLDDGKSREVDVRKLNEAERQEFINRNFKITEEDHTKFWNKLRELIDKVEIPLPMLEVWFLNLKVEAGCHVNSRALPTLLNTGKNLAELLLQLCRVKNAQKVKLAILIDVSGIGRPSREEVTELMMVIGATYIVVLFMGVDNCLISTTHRRETEVLVL